MLGSYIILLPVLCVVAVLVYLIVRLVIHGIQGTLSFLHKIAEGVYFLSYCCTAPVRLAQEALSDTWENSIQPRIPKFLIRYGRLLGVVVLLLMTAISVTYQIIHIGVDDFAFALYSSTLTGFVSNISLAYGNYMVIVEVLLCSVLGALLSKWIIDDASSPWLSALYETCFLLLSIALVRGLPDSLSQLPIQWFNYVFGSDSITVGRVLLGIPFVWLGLMLLTYLLREIIGGLLGTLPIILITMIVQSGLVELVSFAVLVFIITLIHNIAYFRVRSFIEEKLDLDEDSFTINDNLAAAILLAIAVVTVAVYWICRLCL